MFFLVSGVVQIGFAEADYTVDEDDTAVVVCIETFNGVPDTEFLVVTLFTSDGTAIADGE